jgi:hypothetical protein
LDSLYDTRGVPKIFDEVGELFGVNCPEPALSDLADDDAAQRSSHVVQTRVRVWTWVPHDRHLVQVENMDAVPGHDMPNPIFDAGEFGELDIRRIVAWIAHPDTSSVVPALREVASGRGVPSQ